MVLAVVLCVLGILFLIYGGMVAALKSGSLFYMLWLAAGICCLIFGILRMTGAWQKMPRGIHLGVHGILIVILVFIAVTQACVMQGMHASGRKNLDTVIVLGAQVTGQGPSAILRYRLDEAADYLKQNPKTGCIVSGGRGANEPETEAAGMKRYLVKQGIDPDRITQEDRSLNTSQNIVNSARMIHPKTDEIGIITSNFHVYRGVKLAQKAGYRHVYGIASYSSPVYLVNNMLRESFGILKDKLAGNI